MRASHAIPGLAPAEPTAASTERLARLEKRFPDRLETLLAAARAAPDPDLALAGIERYADVAGAPPAEQDLLDALALLAGSSRMIPALLARDPRLLRRAARSPLLERSRAEPDLRRVIERTARQVAADDVDGFHRLLRRLRAHEVVRIALRDLRRARVSEVTGDLSALATACLDAAIRFHDRRLRARHGPPAGLAGREPGAGFCALAMGKLGARELNFSSDVDLVYVYERDGETEGERPITHFAYYAKLAELVTEAIAKPTEDGFVFRVDLNLRPDGQNGPIVNSLHATELYYETFGRSWERNALVKARPGAGDLAVGEELLRHLEEFIWRRSLDLDVVHEIQAMKARIDARAGAEGKDDLKLGKGGIREVEFFVSALQLLHGGRDEGRALRERAVLPALDRLLFAGVVPAKDRDALADAYLFLRRAEHRVQMLNGSQTHRLPPPGERRGLARSMGYADEAAFDAALAAHRERVALLFAGVLGKGIDAAPLDPDLALVADPQVERARRAAGSATRIGSSPRSTRWRADARPSRRSAIPPRRWRSSPTPSAHPTPTKRSRTSPTSRRRSRTPSPTSECSPTTVAWRGSCSRSSAPRTSSRSGSCATRSSSTCCSGRTRSCSRRRPRPSGARSTSGSEFRMLRSRATISSSASSASCAATRTRRCSASRSTTSPARSTSRAWPASSPTSPRSPSRAASRWPRRRRPRRGCRLRGGCASSGWESSGDASSATTPTSTSSSSTRARAPPPGTSATPASPSGSCRSCRCRSARGASTRSTRACGRPGTRARSSSARRRSRATTRAIRAPAAEARRCGASSGSARRCCAPATSPAIPPSSPRSGRRCSCRSCTGGARIARPWRARSAGCASGWRRRSGGSRRAARTRRPGTAASSTSSSPPSSSSSRTATITPTSGWARRPWRCGGSAMRGSSARRTSRRSPRRTSSSAASRCGCASCTTSRSTTSPRGARSSGSSRAGSATPARIRAGGSSASTRASPPRSARRSRRWSSEGTCCAPARGALG